MFDCGTATQNDHRLAQPYFGAWSLALALARRVACVTVIGGFMVLLRLAKPFVEHKPVTSDDFLLIRFL